MSQSEEQNAGFVQVTRGSTVMPSETQQRRREQDLMAAPTGGGDHSNFKIKTN